MTCAYSCSQISFNGPRDRPTSSEFKCIHFSFRPMRLPSSLYGFYILTIPIINVAYHVEISVPDDCASSHFYRINLMKKAIMIFVEDDTLAVLDSTVDGISGKDR